jgi:hypothetical protein
MTWPYVGATHATYRLIPDCVDSFSAQRQHGTRNSTLHEAGCSETELDGGAGLALLAAAKVS